jgi:hypothetical protein
MNQIILFWKKELKVFNSQPFDSIEYSFFSKWPTVR